MTSTIVAIVGITPPTDVWPGRLLVCIRLMDWAVGISGIANARRLIISREIIVTEILGVAKLEVSTAAGDVEDSRTC